tara:strand:- start:9983 stop:13459 length:3477 start_codon:yes stop_codon:yes gene_type:complete
MAARKFKFISPGIYTNEVDESIIASTPPILGPVIVGRTRKGPAMRPYTVDNYAEFVDVFGDPVPGPEGSDVWRSGYQLGPTYAAYAAKAWLKANVAPATIVRVLGEEHGSRNSGGTLAGWQTTQGNTVADLAHSSGPTANGGAWGLWVWDSGSLKGRSDADVLAGAGAGTWGTGSLAAVWYLQSGSVIELNGFHRGADEATAGIIRATGTLIKSTGVDNKFKTTLRFYNPGDRSTLVDAIDTTGADEPNAFTITVPTVAGGDGVAHKIEIVANDAAVDGITPAAGWGIAKTTANTAALKAAAIVDAINGTVNSAVGYNGAAVGTVLAAGTLGITAALTAGSTVKITLTMDDTGTAGNVANVLAANNGFAGALLLTTSFSGDVSNDRKLTREFNFDPNGGIYIRDVFNTNPVMTNSDVVKTSEVTGLKNRYWLGETFERELTEKTTTTDSQYGAIIPLFNEYIVANWAARRSSFINPKTGWFFSQDFGANDLFQAAASSTKLFRIVSRDYGEEGHKHKIAIEDIKASPNSSNPFGSFTLAVYPITTYDKNAGKEAIEKYTGCNLNPMSKNYIARRIGDKYVNWDYTLDKHTEYGQYTNQSQYIRVEMNPSLEVDFNKASLPFGVTGPIVPPTAYYESGSNDFKDNWYQHTVGDYPAMTFLTGGMIHGALADNQSDEAVLNVGNYGGPHETHGIPFSGTFPWPTVKLRSSSFDGPGGGPRDDAFFGVSTTKTKAVSTPDHGIGDYLRGMPHDSQISSRFDELTGLPTISTDTAEYSWQFSLDDIRINATTDAGEYVSGSRVDGTSKTAAGSSYKSILDYHDRFWTVMQGGHNGFDVTEAEPLRNSQWTVGTSDQYSHYAWNSVYRALGTVADQDMIEYNLLTAPGITNDDLTDRVIEIAETRADALAIVDLSSVFTPSTENTKSFKNNVGSLSAVVSSIKTRDFNTSYACTYYPWVQIRDTKTSRLLWVPPSVVALGAMGHSEAVSELWMSPAGYNRGNLSKGHSGLPVVSTSEKLTLEERDDLYENNINPIATFPHEGIVVFGQKTLQATPSALDRINVRRLLVYLKKEVSRMSAQVLFDNNLSATWNRFTSLVNPFLASVQTRFGLQDYKVILDETTTTPDLIDRNIMYAKIYIKPARAIEFIAIDFIITKSGASFED